MIKCHIKRKGNSRVKTSGTGKELMAETAFLISEIYKGILQQCPEVAAAYKEHLLVTLLCPESPVWEEPDHGLR